MDYIRNSNACLIRNLDNTLKKMFDYNYKAKNLQEAMDVLEELSAEGYIINRKNNNLHWQIRKDDYDIMLNIWPTTKKYYVANTENGSKHYDNLLETVKKVFSESID